MRSSLFLLVTPGTSRSTAVFHPTFGSSAFLCRSNVRRFLSCLVFFFYVFFVAVVTNMLSPRVFCFEESSTSIPVAVDDWSLATPSHLATLSDSGLVFQYQVCLLAPIMCCTCVVSPWPSLCKRFDRHGVRLVPLGRQMVPLSIHA